VELRGFEPLTPSMRTRCATGLRYSPKNASQRSKQSILLASGDGRAPATARFAKPRARVSKDRSNGRGACGNRQARRWRTWNPAAPGPNARAATASLAF
jgi:hypothetical protein